MEELVRIKIVLPDTAKRLSTVNQQSPIHSFIIAVPTYVWQRKGIWFLRSKLEDLTV